MSKNKKNPSDLGFELDAVGLARLEAREGEAGQLTTQLPLTVPLRHIGRNYSIVETSK